MSSFIELKPQCAISPWSKNVDELLFTYPRHTVPPQLEARGVSHSTWMKTYDGVAGIYEESLSTVRGMKLPIFFLVPCLAPCFLMPKMIRASLDIHAAWIELVQSQAEIYRRYGINVTLAKEYRSRTIGTGSDRRFDMRLETVGLRFEMSSNVDAPVHQHAGHAAFPAVQATAVAKDDTLTRLEKANDLYRDGAISYDEYTQLKSRIMAGK